MPMYKNAITALIGPSGCGKSTLIRCLNRMNDLIPSASVEGRVIYHGEDIYGAEVDAVEVRKRIGMVFQKPNPFPKSIYDNIAFGPRILGMKDNMDEIVEKALRGAALWDEVKDRLDTNAFGMSGGQQQRLCIARCLAVNPDVILMDEPCSALDPISTGKIEDLMLELKKDYSIVIVTHNMQQAARVSDMTAFLIVKLDDDEKHRQGRAGRVRRDREDLHQPLRPAHRGLRHREGRLMPDRTPPPVPGGARRRSRTRALDGLDLVVAQLERAVEAVEHQDTELAELVIAERRRGRRALPRGPPVDPHPARDPGAGRHRPAADRRPPAPDEGDRADGRSVREHREGDSAHRPRSARRRAHRQDIVTMGKQVRTQLSQAKRAFADRDVDMARDLVLQDDVVDNLNKEIFRIALEIGDDIDRREWAMTMILVARAIERIGDNTVDIGEQVAFIVTGLFREFQDASHPGSPVPN